MDWSLIKEFYAPTENGVVEVFKVTHNGTTLWEKEKELPDGFVKVKWLQSHGTECIKTGFKPNQDSAMELDGSAIKQAKIICGVRKSDATSVPAFTINVSSTEQYVARFGLDTSNKMLHAWNSTDIQHAKISKDGYFWWGNKISNTKSGSWSLDQDVYLFACNVSGSPTLQATAKISRCRLWQGDELVHDFIACIRSDDMKPGMYDVVGNVFYINAGTGEFEFQL